MRHLSPYSRAFLISCVVALKSHISHVHSGLCAETPFPFFLFLALLPAAAGSFLNLGPSRRAFQHGGLNLPFFFLQTSNPRLWVVGVCVRPSCTFTAHLLPRLAKDEYTEGASFPLWSYLLHSVLTRYLLCWRICTLPRLSKTRTPYSCRHFGYSAVGYLHIVILRNCHFRQAPGMHVPLVLLHGLTMGIVTLN